MSCHVKSRPSKQGTFTSSSLVDAMSSIMSLYRSIGVNDGKGLKACFLFISTGPLIKNVFIANKCFMVNV